MDANTRSANVIIMDDRLILRILSTFTDENDLERPELNERLSKIS